MLFMEEEILTKTKKKKLKFLLQFLLINFYLWYIRI